MISVIIPTLNEEKCLPLLLDSLRNQTFQNFEIIISDGNSKDRTRELAAKYGCKIVQKEGLPGKARNYGAEVAKYNIFLFLDADVVLPLDFLEIAIDEFKEKDLSIASCYIKASSEKKLDNFLYGVANFYFKVTRLFRPQAIGHCIIIKKAIHQQIGGFDNDIKIAEDMDYTLRASKIGKFDYLKNIKIPVCSRRLEKEGRLRMSIKYYFIALHFFILGPIKSDVFNYRFGHYNEDE